MALVRYGINDARTLLQTARGGTPAPRLNIGGQPTPAAPAFPLYESAAPAYSPALTIAPGMQDGSSPVVNTQTV